MGRIYDDFTFIPTFGHFWRQKAQDDLLSQLLYPLIHSLYLVNGLCQQCVQTRQQSQTRMCATVFVVSCGRPAALGKQSMFLVRNVNSWVLVSVQGKILGRTLNLLGLG